MKWRQVGKHSFRWEFKLADWWLGGFGPQDKGGYRHYFITIPPLGLPLLPLHVTYPHDVTVKIPVIVINQHMRPLMSAEWAQDGPLYRQMLIERTVLAGGKLYPVIQASPRLDLSPPCLYILVYDDRALDTPAKTGSGEYSDWEGFYAANPQADPFSG